MTRKRLYGPCTILGLRQDMVYGPSFVFLVLKASRGSGPVKTKQTPAEDSKKLECGPGDGLYWCSFFLLFWDQGTVIFQLSVFYCTLLEGPKPTALEDLGVCLDYMGMYNDGPRPPRQAQKAIILHSFAGLLLFFWVAVKELKVSYQIPIPYLLVAIYPYHGNLY